MITFNPDGTFCIPQIPDTGDKIDRLEVASSNGDLDAARQLMEEMKEVAGWDWFLKTTGGPLYKAVTNKQADIVEYLLSEGGQFYIQLAVDAALNKDTATLNVLLRHGWNINEQREAFLPAVLSVAVVDEELTKWFLAHGADPNAICELDITPLSMAVASAPFDVIKLLFAQGGSTEHGQLLHYAATRAQDDRLEVLAYIFDKGMPINDIMYQNSIQSYTTKKQIPLGTPMHFAAEAGKLDVVRWLIEHGAHPLIRDSIGSIPLGRAKAYNHRDVIEYLGPITASASEPPEQFTDGEGRRAVFDEPVPEEYLVN